MKTRVLLSLLALSGIAQAQTAPAPTAPAPTAPAPTAPAAPEAAPFFRDVPRDHWAYAAVQRLAAAGIIQGVPPTAAAQKTVGAPRVAVDANVVKVKTALGNSSSLDGVSLNVVSLKVGRVNQKALIVLTGTARTEAQSQLATVIARKNAPGHIVVNQLNVVR